MTKTPTREGNGTGWRLTFTDDLTGEPITTGFYQRAHGGRGYEWFADCGGHGDVRYAGQAIDALHYFAVRK